MKKNYFNFNNYLDTNIHSKIKDLQIMDNNLGGRSEKNAYKHVKWIKNVIGIEEVKKVVDLGCGVGYYAKAFAALYNCESILAIDISQDSIDEAKNNNLDNNIEFICGDILEVSFSVNNDIIFYPYSTFNLFNLNQGKFLFKKIYESLNDSGILYFEGLSFSSDIQSTPPVAHYVEKDEFIDIKEHIILNDNTYNEKLRELEVKNYYIDLSDLTTYTTICKLHTYTISQYIDLLKFVGFKDVRLIDKTPPGSDMDPNYLNYINVIGYK